jgi:hypothetical protein
VPGGWKRLLNEEFRNLYASPNIIRVMRLVGHVACIGEMRNAYKILVGKPHGKRSLGRFGHRWDDIIGTDIKEIEPG